MSKDQVRQRALEKAKAFTKAQNGRFSAHVSDQFIEVFLSNGVMMQYSAQTNPHPVNQAYRAAVQLFENLLEKGCKIACNGHHVAQEFAAFFENETFKTNPNG